jgi:hypothetical protein
MKRLTGFAVIGTLLALLICQPAGAAGSKGTTAPTTGGWVNQFCAFDHFDPQTGEASCWGATQFAGTWTGHTIAHVQAHVDPKTGNIRIDRIDETFIGVASDGSQGTLHFLEHGYVDGASHTFYVEATIIKGTGDWIGATGQYVFDGYMTGDATGIGGWHGEWTRP